MRVEIEVVIDGHRPDAVRELLREQVQRVLGTCNAL
jgi:flagellar motor component MotA